jgi:arginine decarboxylase
MEGRGNVHATVDEEQRDLRSELTDTLNHVARKAIRWCTPSIDMTFAQVVCPYASDTSISYESLGYPADPSGIFKDVYEKAARAYGADHTLFSVNGTTGSNFMVLRALSRQIPNLRLLAGRNVHRSVVVACEDYRINLILLEPNIDQANQLFLPHTEDSIYEGIARAKPQVLLLVNPTYEGMSLNLERVVSTIRKRFPEIIVFVDEAWGAHLHFSEKLPVSAMEAGADICVQSTHKQGGSLQQSGMIHWKDGKINNDLLMESYRGLGTSSPSYILLASLDAARATMERMGREKIDHICTIAASLARDISRIDGLVVVDPNQLGRSGCAVYGCDATKVIVNVSDTGLNGYDIARTLERQFNIVVEGCNISTLLFLVPFRASLEDVRNTVAALECISKTTRAENAVAAFNIEIPTKISRILELGDVARLLWNQVENVPLAKAVGRIAAEHITPFPPGIPITIKGEEMTSEIVEYYQRLKAYANVHVAARDKTMETVWVVK